MCGLVGVYHFDKDRPVDRDRLIAQNDTLMHRGPDAGAVWVGKGVGLGHRRLSIIDVAGGLQPMWDAEKRVGVVFNGEIYNYRELNQELQARGHRFQTNSDTETIIHAFREWGDACVERFYGMFAFAVLDRETRSLLVARDRLGKKPLYYYLDDDRLVFASEMKALLADPTIPRALEPTAVVDFLAYKYVPGPGSIMQKISKLPAGHLMVVKDGRHNIRKYWDVDFSQVDPQWKLEDLEGELSDAVKLRLRSDVPLGAFLSGGVDSSLVVAMMARQMDQAVKTHTIGFTEEQYDERAYARDTAELFHTDHVEKVVEVDAVSVIDRLSWFYDEPFADSSALPTYYLCQATRERVTVALSGDGGDESFGGYRRYTFALAEEAVRSRVPEKLRKSILSPLGRIYPKADYLPQYLRAKATLTNLGTSFDRAYFLSLTQRDYPKMLSGDFLGGMRDYDPFIHFEKHLSNANTQDPLARLQYLDLKTYLCDDILVKVDRASMAHALEVRVPMLDHRIVERAARLPSKDKIDGRETKIALKQVARKVLPPRVFDRKKMGFTVPVPEWLKGGLKSRAESVLFDKSGGQSGLLDGAGLRRMWYEHQLGLSNHAMSLWSALMFELWYRRFLGSERGTSPQLPRAAKPTEVMTLD